MTDQSQVFPGTQFISTILHSLDAKTAMSGALARVYLMRAAMAGVIIGILYLADFAVLAVFAEIGNGALAPLGRIVGALVFGFALVFIYFSKSELLTSNMMIVSIGRYFKRISVVKSLRILLLCYAGNFLGGLALALLLMGSTLVDGGVGVQLDAAVDHKLSYMSGGLAGWTDLFVRAILCNFMINLAMLLVYNGMIKSDVMKSIAMIVSVFIFAFIGFEHSVANTVVFTIVGLQSGIDLGLAAGNLAIVLAGNFIGGGLLIGIYYAYANDARKHLDRQSRKGKAIAD
ncbi:formate/nitrite transporter family protein [Demequina sediminicola]|uniref:formate/nitrite transporter family protein n=1 Tax=Demequina sediminicola TaxID=1095026 RepID=UPI000782E37E|nr:formate/nitrite transporter family protein [Demequina sediminicola]